APRNASQAARRFPTWNACVVRDTGFYIADKYSMGGRTVRARRNALHVEHDRRAGAQLHLALHERGDRDPAEKVNQGRVSASPQFGVGAARRAFLGACNTLKFKRRTLKCLNHIENRNFLGPSGEGTTAVSAAVT